jgi:hypothetical protein
MDNLPENDQDFFERLAVSISKRYRTSAGKSLWDVFQLNEIFLDTEADATFAIRNREKILAVLAAPEQRSRLVDLFVNATIEFTYASNQFIHLDAWEEGELRRIYQSYLDDLQVLLTNPSEQEIESGMKKLVAGHFWDLRMNISRFFDGGTGQDVQANMVFNQAVCAEYSPALQMEILGIRLDQLIEPVLDIGCGKSGKLVTYLNENGIQAFGVDRLVDLSPYLSQTDWLMLDLQPNTWGTILSHLAFSNHFTFQHLYKYGKVEPYARQYMEILSALKPEGSFYYTPGLPFIETYLPADRYSITRRKIYHPEQESVPALALNLQEGLYTAKIKKML